MVHSVPLRQAPLLAQKMRRGNGHRFRQRETVLAVVLDERLDLIAQLARNRPSVVVARSFCGGKVDHFAEDIGQPSVHWRRCYSNRSVIVRGDLAAVRASARGSLRARPTSPSLPVGASSPLPARTPRPSLERCSASKRRKQGIVGPPVRAFRCGVESGVGLLIRKRNRRLELAEGPLKPDRSSCVRALLSPNPSANGALCQ
jgi:hypothetical protein